MSRFHHGNILLLSTVALFCVSLQGSTNLINSDPIPLYSAEYPFDFVSMWEREYYRGLDDTPHYERFAISISPFRQTADQGRDIYKNRVEIGDIRGRWNMLGIFYPTDTPGTLNEADPCDVLPELGLQLVGSGTCIGVEYICDPTFTCSSVVNPSLSDPKKQVGFFSIPIAYRRYGVRFQLDLRLFAGFGLRVQTGVADVTQTVTAWNDLTLTSTGTALVGDCSVPGCIDSTLNCKKLISQSIMDQRELIAKKLNVSIRDYQKTGMEDTRIDLFWQGVYPINAECDGWPYFLFVPYVSFEAVIPTSDCIDPRCLFAVPLGNNGHTGLGFLAGMDFDFIDSIEIGIQGGFTRFNTRRYHQVPVPTSELQAGIFPFKADYDLSPGTNWEFTANMKAHYFLDRFSAFLQYQVVNHNKDCFTNVAMRDCSCQLSDTVPPALTKKMRELSEWRVHVFNVSLTYDISPHCSFGLLWQAPVSRTNAYRSSTVLWSVIGRF